MAEHPKTIDITDVPDILRLAEEVSRSNQPRILQRAGEDLAVVLPVGSRPKRRRGAKTEAELAAFRASAGGWKGLVDTDQFIKDVYESRRISTRPPVEL